MKPDNSKKTKVNIQGGGGDSHTDIGENEVRIPKKFARNRVKEYIRLIWRRRKFVFSSIRHIPKLAVCGSSMLLHRRFSTAYPLFLKIDLSPHCNIHCKSCIHAKAPETVTENESNWLTLLRKQQFSPNQRMPLDDYRKIIDECRGHTISVVLHWLGDPYMSPIIDEAARYAFDAGMRVHVGTNFSYPFTDQRIDSIVRSGITDLTVCVDSLSQELYEKTRSGAKMEYVLHNLERVCKQKKELGIKHLHVEVQYLVFPHNPHEVEAAKQKVLSLGVNQFTTLNGNTTNMCSADPNSRGYIIGSPHQRKRMGMPECHWGYTSMVIRYDGGIVPCCCYRLGSQYADGISSPVLGNVFKDGVRKVWNSPQYQQLRKMIFNPSAIPSKHYCYGCPVLFDTQREECNILKD